MAIGSPFGNEQSVSTGIVSAPVPFYRPAQHERHVDLCEHDPDRCAINPGNSGGALVNDEGKLIASTP